jgi:hypothetical protein
MTLPNLGTPAPPDSELRNALHVAETCKDFAVFLTHIED